MYITRGEIMKKYLKTIILILIFGIIAGVVSTVAIYNYTDNIGENLTVDTLDTKSADCIIVLGAGVYGDRPSLTLAKRLDKAVEIYNLGHTNKIIVSGDHGRKNYDEVNVMRDYLVSKGIEKENIFMDHAGFSTYESMYRARDIFEVKTAIVVTQQLHLRRALYIANELGIDCQGVNADDAIRTVTKVQSVREYPARVKAFLQCEILHSKPKYLGDVIPIYGSGIVTEG